MRCNVHQRVCLAQANTLQLPCVAEYFAAPQTLSQLRQRLAQARKAGWPVTVLGGGSNVLLPEFLPGLTVTPAMQQWWLETGENEVHLHVGAGVAWHPLVMEMAARGLWGIENLALIPGHCGAAPIQNIGAYGVELADVLEAVQVMDILSGKLRWLTHAQCEFGYRDSIFKRALANRVVITRLVMRLTRTPAPRLGYGDLAARLGKQPTALEVAQAVSDIRREKLPDPQELANAGSFFKNPLVSAERAERLRGKYPSLPSFPQADGRVKLAAGWLIEQCGLKGRRSGAFGVHERQALVLVHFGGGTRKELLEVAAWVSGEVEATFDVALEPEPRFIG
ncbi:UDP-N-acetylmuramate dehydrogenase [Vreelandella rituensis]|uniref:UDP-N-acetylenolpyruvoylglucosamine reductase n=1 Tax=Vreelandella rituensis TaxID=2282306 RepID=A0A368TRN2_9GAMM|nr:UDP-N-acetylmuramate dehydrogenase [Halomonas rituensis]RCV87271.1 UDP-N-acetylmuramate dehydrogenase [Halomonas rituensis]